MTEPNHLQPQQVFEIVDTMDVDKFTSLFTENARLTFGNEPSYQGLSAIRDGVTGFFGTIAGIQHTIVRLWEVGDDTIAHVDATYRRNDGTELTLAAATIYHTNGAGKIDDYRVFVDVTPIYV
ncbi:hypothetical protein AWC29_21450 [Mycobacterium triplex]|uniref:Ketosteroid isomerase-related protein n=1 Tax=Mycobacterium triplex TaxID=47839 RepID=A0A024JZF8_9MYCO|nr:nuclear transport factor 2 family protein [Mycobacterium triplex]ORX01773.1 hypothetical protein AWC29_21450 [Mycobacterium triplex]CDO89056.1 Ketosteroid isomerase-related protein [Mycobacterium triplex]